MKMTDSQKEIYRLNKFPMKISTIWYKEIKTSNSTIDIGPKNLWIVNALLNQIKNHEVQFVGNALQNVWLMRGNTFTENWFSLAQKQPNINIS